MTEGRCPWADRSPLERAYHDDEWGVPSHDDPYLFELLVLESAQAGLSWTTILGKREGYRRALAGFEPSVVATFGEDEVAAMLLDPGIVRHGQKVRSHVKNAQAFLAVQDEHGSFATHLWRWVDDRPITNHPTAPADVPTRTDLSDRLAKDLKRRGFSFLGSTTLYAYLQAVGVVDDHLVTCPAKRNP